MDIRSLPAEIPYVLAEHHEVTRTPNPDYPENVEGLTEEDLLQLPPRELEKIGDVIPGSPTFVFKPLTPRERGRWANRLYGDNVTRSERTDLWLDLFEERILRIDGLKIDGEDFDKDKHLDSIELKWQTEVAMVVFTQSKLSDQDAGK